VSQEDHPPGKSGSATHTSITHLYDLLQPNTSGTQQAELGENQMPRVHGMIRGWLRSPIRHHQHLTQNLVRELKRSDKYKLPGAARNGHKFVLRKHHQFRKHDIQRTTITCLGEHRG
jgi:hypothetical protein